MLPARPLKRALQGLTNSYAPTRRPQPHHLPIQPLDHHDAAAGCTRCRRATRSARIIPPSPACPACLASSAPSRAGSERRSTSRPAGRHDRPSGLPSRGSPAPPSPGLPTILFHPRQRHRSPKTAPVEEHRQLSDAGHLDQAVPASPSTTCVLANTPRSRVAGYQPASGAHRRTPGRCCSCFHTHPTTDARTREDDPAPDHDPDDDGHPARCAARPGALTSTRSRPTTTRPPSGARFIPTCSSASSAKPNPPVRGTPP